MKKHVTKIQSLMAMIVMSVAMTAQTYTNEGATITWAFTSHESLGATPSPEDAFLSTNFSYGSNLTAPTTFSTKNCKAGWAEQTLVFFKPVEPVAKNAEDAAGNMLEWTITPASGITFTPASVSITACTAGGTGDPQVTIYAVYSDQSQETVQARTNPRRPDKTDQGDGPSVYSKELENAVAGAFKVRLYFAGLTSTSKGAAVTNIIVTGTVSGTPAASTMYTISTAANIEAAGTVTGAGSYAEGASVTLTASENAGYAFVNWTKAGDSEWSSTENPMTVEVTADETYTANYKQLLTVQFDEIATYLASAKNPLAGVFYAGKDDKFTIPAYAHKYLYSANNTFVEWSDGTNTYQPGAEVTLTDNVTLTPVFTATTKTLANITSEFNLTWDLQHAQIEFNLQGANQQVYYTQTATIGGQKVSIPMTVDATNGKVNNMGRSDQWAQVNNGTMFVLPAVEGMTIVANGYSAFTNATAVAGAEITEDMLSNGGKTLTYTYTGSVASIEFIVNGPSYMSTIQVTYPVTEEIPVEGVAITGIKVDGESISFPAEINMAAEDYTATWEAENIYTTVPVVVASFSEGADETGLVSGTGASRTYTFTKADRTFKLIISNLYVYEPAGDEVAVAIKHNEGSVADNVWTNGVYTFTTTGIGSSGGADFKFDANTDAPYTISVPADIVVKQFIIRNFHANYSGGNGQLKTVTSEGATTYLPTKRTCVCNVIGSDASNRQYEGEAFDLVVNIANHTAGQPIVFTMLKSAQPMGWIELTTVKEVPTTAPVKTGENVVISDNDAAILVSFDREIAGDVTATIGTQSVIAKGGGSALLFNAWDLSYSTDYTLTIAAGAVEDTYGNVTDAAIEVAVNVPAKAAVTPAVYDYVVSTVSELDAALEAVQASNPTSNKSAARKTIFIKNGDYDLGEVKDGDNYQTVRWLNANNVSLIGESRDGVILHGYSTGISNPVLNLRYGQGFYLQDLTIRNDFDYGTGEFRGVSVAIYGGDKTIMKNVRLLSNQDTQVTGHRMYHEDCAIHGTVDFICGGGDNYYYHTELVLEDRGGNVIVAPSTNATQQWGYVFDECTIKGVDAAAAASNAGSYFLGRPWQNEPRTYFLHTTMEVQAAAAGWTSMGNLPTHFYEYDTRDAEGAAIDLSARQNSPTSTNTYVPVLTDDEAASFSVRSVLGGEDAWDAAAQAALLSAPANVAVSVDGNLTWDAADDALCYVVLKDGAYLTNVATNSFAVTASGAYSVKAANCFGGLGIASAAVNYTDKPTAIDNANAIIQATKVVRNGQLFIIRDGKTYTAQGAEVK